MLGCAVLIIAERGGNHEGTVAHSQDGIYERPDDPRWLRGSMPGLGMPNGWAFRTSRGMHGLSIEEARGGRY
jgi:hypothetical protein